MFRFTQEPSSGSSLCLAKTTEYGFSVLVDIDAINVMAAYQSVVQACCSQWGQEKPLNVTHQLVHLYTGLFISPWNILKIHNK